MTAHRTARLSAIFSPEAMRSLQTLALRAALAGVVAVSVSACGRKAEPQALTTVPTPPAETSAAPVESDGSAPTLGPVATARPFQAPFLAPISTPRP